MEPHIFVCHSSRDQKLAQRICERLETHGMRCWIAPRDIPAGSAWVKTILDAIARSRLLLLVYSPESDRSEEVMDEIQEARRLGLPILVFRTADFLPSRQMRFRLGRLQWLDDFALPLEYRIEKLRAASGALLGKPHPAVIVPARRRTVPLLRRAMPALVVLATWVVLLVALSFVRSAETGIERDADSGWTLTRASTPRPAPPSPQVPAALVPSESAASPVSAEPKPAGAGFAERPSDEAPPADRPTSRADSADASIAVPAPAPVATGERDAAKPADASALSALMDLLPRADPFPEAVLAGDALGAEAAGADEYRDQARSAQIAADGQDWPAAAQHYASAAETAEAALRLFAGSVRLRADTAELLRLDGAYASTCLGQTDYAAARLVRAMAVARELPESASSKPVLLCEIRREQALLARQQGDAARALLLAGEAEAFVDGLPFKSEMLPFTNGCQLLVKKAVASWAIEDGRFDRAAFVLAQIEALTAPIAAGERSRTWLAVQEPQLLWLRGRLAAARGDRAAAIAAFDAAAAMAQSLLDRTPDSSVARSIVVDILRSASRARADVAGRAEEALGLLNIARDRAAQLPDPHAAQRGIVDLELARLLRASSRQPEAAQALDRARELADSRYGLGALEAGFNRLALAAYAESGNAALAGGERANVRGALERAATIAAALRRIGLGDGFVVASQAAVSTATEGPQ